MHTRGRSIVSCLVLLGGSLAFAQQPNGVRGTVQIANADFILVNAPTGLEKVKLAKGAKVYDRVASNRDAIKAGAFVGITSVKMANGTERASEVHIFPDTLKGTGEGSRMMGTEGPGGRPNRMTNGTVKVVGAPSRMTNGTVMKDEGGLVTLTYKGGSRTIVIPAKASVTTMVPVPLSNIKPGTNVFALGTKQKDGSWLAERVFLIKASKK